MSEEFNEFPDAPASIEEPPKKKSNKTLWIILGIAAALLLCCCVIIVGLIFMGVIDYAAWAFHPITPLLALI